MSKRYNNIYRHLRSPNHQSTARTQRKIIRYTKERCKQFGCGKKLTPTETLYGDYCFVHAQQRNQQIIKNIPTQWEDDTKIQ